LPPRAESDRWHLRIVPSFSIQLSDIAQSLNIPRLGLAWGEAAINVNDN
jgi:hypothetical protein